MNPSVVLLLTRTLRYIADQGLAVVELVFESEDSLKSQPNRVMRRGMEETVILGRITQDGQEMPL